MAQNIPEENQRDIETQLKQVMDNPEVEISRVAGQWWELKNASGEVLVKLFDKPTYRDNADLEFFGNSRYSLSADIMKRLLDYAAKAQYNHSVREYVDELNNVLREINKYGKNPNFENFKITATHSEAINKAVEAVAMNLIRNPANPVEDIIIGEQLIYVQNGAGQILMSINLQPYGDTPNVKLMETTPCRLAWDAVERIQKAIYREINLRRIRSATTDFQKITSALAPYTTPRSSNSDGRR